MAVEGSEHFPLSSENGEHRNRRRKHSVQLQTSCHIDHALGLSVDFLGNFLVVKTEEREMAPTAGREPGDINVHTFLHISTLTFAPESEL